jgi:hypothetical protein
MPIRAAWRAAAVRDETPILRGKTGRRPAEIYELPIEVA